MIVINTPLEYVVYVNPERSYEFWDQFPGLVWSNRHASDTVMIRATLMRGKFDVFQAVAHHFGYRAFVQGVGDSLSRPRNDDLGFPP